MILFNTFEERKKIEEKLGMGSKSVKANSIRAFMDELRVKKSDFCH